MGQKATTASSSSPWFSTNDAPPLGDQTLNLPDDCLAVIFHRLSNRERNNCSLVCRRWHAVESASRHSLTLLHNPDLLPAVPALFSRFSFVSKLSLCPRWLVSEGFDDEALHLISFHCRYLTDLELVHCYGVTDKATLALSKHCPFLRKICFEYCRVGTKGIDAIAVGCLRLEELSFKNICNQNSLNCTVSGSTSLRLLRLASFPFTRHIYPLIAESPKLRSLEIIRCGHENWDDLFEEVALRRGGSAIEEMSFERTFLKDKGINAMSTFVGLKLLRLIRVPELEDAYLQATMMRCRSLEKIEINGLRGIGDDGFKSIATFCSNLRHLTLSDVSPTAASLSLIASKCHKLESLAVSNIKTIGDEELLCIASKCISLQQLSIKGCPITDMGIEALTECCPNLQELLVARCPKVTTEGVVKLQAKKRKLLVLAKMAKLAMEQGLSHDGVRRRRHDEIDMLFDNVDQFARDLLDVNLWKRLLGDAN